MGGVGSEGDWALTESNRRIMCVRTPGVREPQAERVEADSVAARDESATMPLQQPSPSAGLDPQALYVVILPRGVRSELANVVGGHSFVDIDSARIHFGWVLNDGTVDSVTRAFSEVLVESCSDPEGNAIQGLPGVCVQDG